MEFLDDFYCLIFKDENSKPNLTNVERTISRLTTVSWQCSLYWLFKEEEKYKNLEPPYDQKTVNMFKPHGLLMGEVWNLCKELQPIYVYKYGKDKAPSSWLELFKSILIEALQDSKTPYEKSKKNKLQIEREQLEKLKNLDNPYCEDTEPKLFELIQICIDNYYTRPMIINAYSNFLKAMKNWIVARDPDHKGGSQWQSVYEECSLKPKSNQAKRTLKINQGKTRYAKILASDQWTIQKK